MHLVILIAAGIVAGYLAIVFLPVIMSLILAPFAMAGLLLWGIARTLEMGLRALAHPVRTCGKAWGAMFSPLPTLPYARREALFARALVGFVALSFLVSMAWRILAAASGQ